jgi:hypothetical protein
MSEVKTMPEHGMAGRFRPRRLALANGELMVMAADGTIERRDAAGTCLERWGREDAAWASVAIRFGVRAAPETVVPRGRDVPGTRPPV